MLWSAAFEIVYDINYIVLAAEMGTGVFTEYGTRKAYDGLCSTGIYFVVAILGVVNYLYTCIAVNLMLTICFGVNPIKNRESLAMSSFPVLTDGQDLERWYVGLSITVGMGVPVVPAILGHFGWDSAIAECWIKTGGSETTHIKRLVLDIYLWQALSCVICLGAVIATLVVLYRQTRQTRRALRGGDQVNDEIHRENIGSRSTSSTGETLEDQLLKISLRILLYPISLVCINGLITVADLYVTKHGVHNVPVYILFGFFNFWYGGRGIIFTGLGIFVDPSLRRKRSPRWKVICKRPDLFVGGSGRMPSARLALTLVVQMTNSSVIKSAIDPQAKHSLLHFLEEQAAYDMVSSHLGKGDDALEYPVRFDTRKDSTQSIELSHALLALPSEVPKPILLYNMSRAQGDEEEDRGRLRERGIPAFTRSFSGVPAGVLPTGLTDEVDVVPSRLSHTSPNRNLKTASWVSSAQVDLEKGQEGDTSATVGLDPLEPDIPTDVEERDRSRVERRWKREEQERLFQDVLSQL
ncbi:hypothetical protein P7C73_g3946, partial [Tremellales sp. Uapishka_1]